MSKIIWSQTMMPGADIESQDFVPACYEGAFRVPNTKALPVEERKVKLPDRRVFRSMSRAAVLMSSICIESKDAMAEYLEKDAFRVGVYCAVENGPVDFESTKQMKDTTKETFANDYSTYRNPKMYLRQLPNLAAAQMGIFLGILGPMNVYNHSSQGGIAALEQAEMDLKDKRVDAALVCSAFSFENPLVVERARRFGPEGRTICEGAGAILLVDDGDEIDWKNQDYNCMDEYFGISQQIIEIANRRAE